VTSTNVFLAIEIIDEETIIGCSRSSETILKFIVLAFNKRNLFEALADYCT